MTKFNRNNVSAVDYIWVDGNQYAARVRNKSRVLPLPDQPQIDDYPAWTFDGSLTDQEGSEDLHLIPVRQYVNPFKGGRNYLVLCEVNDATSYAHFSNHRSGLRLLLDNSNIAPHQAWLGFGQHYSLVPLADAEDAMSKQATGQGDAALDEADRRQTLGDRIAEAHAKACLDAGVHLHSWHRSSYQDHRVFQLGCRDEDDHCDALQMADDLWVARYLLERLAEDFNQAVVYDSLAAQAPLATSISTVKTRSELGGIAEIQRAISVLETLEIVDKTSNEFKRQFYRSEDFNPGYTSRQSAFRIPAAVVLGRCGYFVDQRPRAKSDPYRIAQYLLGSLLVSEVSSNRRTRIEKSTEVGA